MRERRARSKIGQGRGQSSRRATAIRSFCGFIVASIISLAGHSLEAADPFGPRDTESSAIETSQSAGYPAGFQVAAAALRVPGVLLPEEPWRRFATTARLEPGQPAIAIVIDDLGMSAREVDDVLALGEPVTLSFLPDGTDAPRLARYARRAGQEILVHVPMEPLASGHRLGAYGLKVGYGGAANRSRLATILGRFGAYVGINNHMGSRFTGDVESMVPVLAELKQRGLMFLDSRTTAETQGNRLAAVLEVPHAMRDVFIDAEMSPAAIDRELARLERVAREKGLAIAIGHPHAMTLNALRAWMPQAKARGFAFVPISYAARRNCGC